MSTLTSYLRKSFEEENRKEILENKIIKQQKKEINRLLKDMETKDKEISSFSLLERKQIMDWSEGAKRLLQIEKQCSKLTYELTAKLEKIENMEKEITQLDTDLREREDKLEKVVRERDILKREHKTVGSVIKGLENKNKQLLEVLEGKAGEIGTLEGKLSELQMELMAKSEGMEEATVCLKEMVEKFKLLDEHCQVIKHERDICRKELNEVELKQSKGGERIRKLEDEILECRRQRNDHFSESKSHESEAKAMKSEVMYLEDRVQHLEKVLKSQNETLMIQKENLDYYKDLCRKQGSSASAILLTDNYLQTSRDLNSGLKKNMNSLISYTPGSARYGQGDGAKFQKSSKLDKIVENEVSKVKDADTEKNVKDAKKILDRSGNYFQQLLIESREKMTNSSINTPTMYMKKMKEYQQTLRRFKDEKIDEKDENMVESSIEAPLSSKPFVLNDCFKANENISDKDSSLSGDDVISNSTKDQDNFPSPCQGFYNCSQRSSDATINEEKNYVDNAIHSLDNVLYDFRKAIDKFDSGRNN